MKTIMAILLLVSCSVSAQPTPDPHEAWGVNAGEAATPEFETSTPTETPGPTDTPAPTDTPIPTDTPTLIYGLLLPSGALVSIGPGRAHLEASAGDGEIVEVVGPVPDGPTSYDRVSKRAVLWQQEVQARAVRRSWLEQDRATLRQRYAQANQRLKLCLAGDRAYQIGPGTPTPSPAKVRDRTVEDAGCDEVRDQVLLILMQLQAWDVEAQITPEPTWTPTP